MSSRASWLSWIGSSERTEGEEPDVSELRRMLRERDAEIHALTQRVQQLADAADRAQGRALALEERTDELAELLGEAESACAKLESSLREADIRCVENAERLTTESGRAEVASQLAMTADERYRDVVERWRSAERALVRAQQDRTLAKEHQAELQLALSKSVHEREVLRNANQKLQAQLKVAHHDKEDAAVASSQRLVQVEQRARFAFDDLECLGDDAHHLLRLTCEGLWGQLGEGVAAALRDVRSNVVQDWIERRFAECATTEDVVAATSDVLTRLRLARIQLEEHVPLAVTITPLGAGLSGSDAAVRLAVGILQRVVKVRLGVELSATVTTDGTYRVCFRVDGKLVES